MPAGRNKRHERRLEIRIREIVSRDMPADMIHRNKRQIIRESERLRETHPDKQSAYQPRRVRHGDRVDVRKSDSRPLKRLIRDPGYRVAVRAPGDLRNDAAVKTVRVDLRRYYVGAYDPLAVNKLADGGGGLVAGAFKG